MESLGVLIVIFILIFGALLAYRNRFAIAKWLRDPTCSSSVDPKARRKYLIRKMEDCQDEIDRFDGEEQNRE